MAFTYNYDVIRVERKTAELLGIISSVQKTTQNREKPTIGDYLCPITFHLPASKVSREVANLTERKNLHNPVYGVKEFFRPSVSLSVQTNYQDWQNRMG